MSDINYVYVGDEWEPKIGEVCEVVTGEEKWRECTIIALGNPNELPHPFSSYVDYTVDVPGYPCASGISPLWLCRRDNLRKRRPPEQKDSAGDFEEMMTRIRFEATKAHIKVIQEEIGS